MLSKSILKQQFRLTQFTRAFSSVPEYDVAVIGGGPGGKSITLLNSLFSHRLRCCYQGWTKGLENCLHREERSSRRNLPQRRMHPIQGSLERYPQVARGLTSIQRFRNRNWRNFCQLPKADGEQRQSCCRID